jgi:hypothetical protein
MLPLISFETGRRTSTQSSGQSERLRQQMEVWFYSHRNRCREATRRAEEIPRIYTGAPPERVGRAFALLTKTYHGSRLTGLAYD